MTTVPNADLSGYRGDCARRIAAEAGYSAPYLYLLDEQLEVPKRTRYTHKKLEAVCRAISQGAGQGRMDSFRPWLRIRRNFSSPVSYQIFESVGINARNHHFLSGLEYSTALLVAYLGAVELRECLPMWPFPHRHPAGSLDGDIYQISRKFVPGLIELAKIRGIEHGNFIGTTVPYVASIDLMFSRTVGGKSKYLGISCKPKPIIDASSRARERIELDREYCSVIDARHVIEDGSDMDALLIKQLKWMCPTVNELRKYQGAKILEDYAGWFAGFSQEMCIADASTVAGRKVRLNVREAYQLFRICVWLHCIDVDLGKNLLMKSPINKGAETIKALRLKYWGDV